MTIGPAPDCLWCAHFENRHLKHFAALGGLRGDRCLAYPRGIPNSIFLNGVEHTKVRSNQEGDYVFRPAKKSGWVKR